MLVYTGQTLSDNQHCRKSQNKDFYAQRGAFPITAKISVERISLRTNCRLSSLGFVCTGCCTTG